MKSILFVCTANICRSPMAEGLLKHLVKTKGYNWKVDSAGVWAIDGLPPVENAINVLLQKGINISEHRSQNLSKQLLEENDLVLVMEKNHKESIVLSFPQEKEKVFLLSEVIGKRFDIVDPIGKSIEEFRATADELESVLKDGFDWISSFLED